MYQFCATSDAHLFAATPKQQHYANRRHLEVPLTKNGTSSVTCSHLHDSPLCGNSAQKCAYCCMIVGLSSVNKALMFFILQFSLEAELLTFTSNVRSCDQAFGIFNLTCTCHYRIQLQNRRQQKLCVCTYNTFFFLPILTPPLRMPSRKALQAQ